MRRWLMAAALAAGGAACGGTVADEPYFTPPPRLLLAPGETAPYEMVSICYNSLTSTPEEIAGMIRAACQNPVFVQNDYIGQCTLSAPARTTWRCSKVDRSVAVVQYPFAPFSGAIIGLDVGLGSEN